MKKPRAVAHRERQQAYHQRQLESGMMRVSVWIPKARRDQFNASVERLKKKWTKEDASA